MSEYQTKTMNEGPYRAEDEAEKNVGMGPNTTSLSLDELAHYARATRKIAKACSVEVDVLERLLRASRDRLQEAEDRERNASAKASAAFNEATT